MKCYTLLTTTEVHTFLNYYHDKSGFPPLMTLVKVFGQKRS